MRDVAWALVIVAGAILVAAGIVASDHPKADDFAYTIGGVLGGLGLLRLAFFRGSTHPDHRDG